MAYKHIGYDINAVCSKFQETSLAVNFYEILVVDPISLNYLRKRKVGRQISVEIGEDLVHLACLSQYDCKFLGEYLVLFDANQGILDSVSELSIPNIISKLLEINSELIQALNSSQQLPKGVQLADYGKIMSVCYAEHDLVYTHFRKLGYCLMSGSSFGVDFLLYETDPDHCHSSHGVLVISESKPLADYHELIMNIRNCNMVGKNLLLCSVTNGEVVVKNDA